MPFFRSPAQDFRLIRRYYAKADRTQLKWVLGWFAGGVAVLALWLIERGVFSTIVARVWLMGGAVYALKQAASFEPLKDEDQISTLAALVLVAIVLLTALVIGGSILDLAAVD